MISNRMGKRLSVCGVIPARIESLRLPGKPLRPICGRPMIGWVYEGARQSTALDRLIVATDSEQIASYCAAEGCAVAMTSSRHTSGTDRLVEVLDQETAAGRAADIYVNIQGDEPMVTAGHIDLLLSGFESATPSHSAPPEGIEVSTLKIEISPETAGDPNAVKVVTDSRGIALYFSRAPIPFDRDGLGQARYYKHLGFYAYMSEALRRFRDLPPSSLELSERLEQLRFLENGIPITVVETAVDSIGVDTEEDLLRVEKYLERVAGRSFEPGAGNR